MADGKEPQLPPIEPAADYLLGYLWDLGGGVQTGMGMVPLHSERLWAWQQVMGFTLSPWEERALRSLSAVYVSESSRAEAPDAPPPWTPEPNALDRQRIATDLGNALRLRKKRKQ